MRRPAAVRRRRLRGLPQHRPRARALRRSGSTRGRRPDERLPDRPVARGDRRRRRVRHGPRARASSWSAKPPHPIIPAAQTDCIFAVWADRDGARGRRRAAAGVPAFAYRGMKVATMAEDGSRSCSPPASSFAFALPGVRHRRRGHAAGAADRHHAAVRVATAARRSSRTSRCSRCCSACPSA